jgi:malate/lactate dehydrogenase
MEFYKIKNNICCAFEGDLPFPKAEAEERADVSIFLFRRDPQTSRTSFRVTTPELLFQEREDASWLSSKLLRQQAGKRADVDREVMSALCAGRLRAVNLDSPRFMDALAGNLLGLTEIYSSRVTAAKKIVHILAIGDVGSHLLTGLHLLGGDVISRIGICDIDDKVTARWEFEENQIGYPWDYNRLPEVYVVDRSHLFDCDVFVFVASAGIPAVGSGVKDVRMVQLEKNRKIIADYARQAREAHFRGLFCEVADPVDPLAKEAFLASNRDENGNFDGRGLLPEQIQGYGLGVMNARAAYYARKNPEMHQFLTDGRTFGPHGQDLVVADSITNYNDEISRKLTELTVKANLQMRALGFKPFVAPAYSSGALSILLTLRGEWHCGSIFLGGIYMGVKNRYTPYGQEHEILPLPDELFARIRTAEAHLHEVN